MNSRVSLLSMIVLLCMGYVLTRGIEEKRIFSANLEVVHPWKDCVEGLGEYENISKCEIDLFNTKSAPLENRFDIAYTMKVKIGNKKQEFKVSIDTGSEMLWVYDSGCVNKYCKNHEKFKHDPKSTTYRLVDKNLDLKYELGKVTGFVAEDTVYLTEGLESKKQLFGLVTKASFDLYESKFDGIIGLNMFNTMDYPVFINAAKEAKMDPIFSIYLKGEASSANDGGEITFGGVNKDHIKDGTEVKVKVIDEVEYIVQMDEVWLGDKEYYCTKGVNCRALIDSGTSMIIGPEAEINKFNKEVLKAIEKDNILEVDCNKIPTFPPMKIKFGKSTLKLEADYYIQRSPFKCWSLLEGLNEPNGEWILGNPFLRKYYSTYNMTPKAASVTFYEAK